MKLMTYNLRFANEIDMHPWSQRRPLLVRQVADAAPAVLGTQEGLRHQLEDIRQGLPRHYAWVGHSREKGIHGEYCAVFYDTRRLEVVDVTQRWFSLTPAVPGSQSWGDCPRIMTAVTLAERASGDEFVVINTHLDQLSVQARRFAADYLLGYVQTAAEGRPTIVMGDFNTAARHSSVYQRLCQTPLVDTFEAQPQPGGDRPTFNNYLPPPSSGPRIDWILVSPDVQVETSMVDTRDFDGSFASDHLPVQATVRLARTPQLVGASTARPGHIPLPAWASPSTE